MASKIEVIARGLVIHRGHVLLCRNVAKGYHYLPGGHVERGESSRAALERELEEEAGISVTAGPLLLILENGFEDAARGKDLHEINLVFHVEHRLDGGSVLSLEEDIAFDWIDLAAAGGVGAGIEPAGSGPAGGGAGVPDDTDGGAGGGLDLRPEGIRAWLAAGGRTPPTATLPYDLPAAPFVSQGLAD